MSLSQWKVLNHLKDSLSKLSNDKSIQNTYGKDLLQMLQKIPTALNNIDLSKYFEYSTKVDVKDGSKNDEKSSLPAVKSKDDAKWKSTLSKSTVQSYTYHALLCIDSAENDEALLARLENFIVHIKKFPEGRNTAIKWGAIQLLLRRRRKITNPEIQGCIRECLSLLGYSDPVPMKGLRVLSMDGGGIRGLLILEMLKKLEDLTGKKTHELFDLVCGVSTGAILAFALTIHKRNIDDVMAHYKSISFEVFQQSTVRGTSNLLWSQAYYDTNLWEKKLQEGLGISSLISTTRNIGCPKVCCVSAVVNQSQLLAYVFRNYSLPWRIKSQYLGGYDHAIWEAVRASAAAPGIFEEFKCGNFVHQDGGIILNNPTAVAIHDAKLIWPHHPLQCVVSFGTGRSVPSTVEFNPTTGIDKINSTSWTNKFYKIIDSATDTEGVHLMLNDLLPDNVYYRFNPYLSELISMVETNPEKIKQLERDVLMYLRRNDEKFQQAANMLTAKKSSVQKVKDFVNYQRDLYGI